MLSIMRFALNYSPQAAELVRSGEISIDLFKCPDWEHLIAEAEAFAPVYVHFPLLVGGGLLTPDSLDQVERLAARTGTRWINAHLYPQIGDFPHLGIASLDGLTSAQAAQIMAQIHADVAMLVDRFGRERVIIENVPFRAPDEQNLRLSVEPWVMNDVIETHQVGFLLDISHASLAAAALGVDERSYIRSLPLKAMRELHVTGTGIVDGYRTDHLHMQPEDWERLEWTLGLILSGEAALPDIIAYEYGGITPKFDWRSRPEMMLRDVPRLYAAAHALVTA
ncbi:DUF692 family protein [Anaerolineae bacterium CFX9]|nr:DUF692 family protein [Anaerolineae bacterium CFX9]